MATHNLEQIKKIVIDNPNKALVTYGVETGKKLSMHVHGEGSKESLEQFDHFEAKDLFDTRKKYLTSNKDVFGRLLQQEEIVFTARGGSQYFNLPDSQEVQMNALLMM